MTDDRQGPNPEQRDGRQAVSVSSGGGMGGAGGGGRRQFRDLTSGSIPKNLWSLAWPQSVEGVMRVVDQMMDLVWAGFLGTRSLAGIGVAQQYTQMAWTARMGIDTAQRAMVSRAVGMGDIVLANHVVFQAATITAAFFVIISGIGILFTEPMLRVLGVSDGVIDQAAPYMRIQFMAQGVMGFQQLFGHALAASGDAITPMRATMASRVLHMILSPFLVFGLLGFPEIGLAGAALASGIANTVGLGLNTRALFSGHSRLHLRLSDYRFDPRLIWQILRIGIPAAVTNAERATAQLILIAIVTPFGDLALAAYTLTRRVEMFSNLGSQGVGQASGIIVGQSLGAGRPDRARQTVLWGVGYVTSIKSIYGLLLFFFPHLFLWIFTRDPELVALASTWIRIQVLGYLAMGLGQVFVQSFQTAGDTVFPMLVSLVAFWVIELPMAYLLAHTLGVGSTGIAAAITIAMCSRLVMLLPYFFWGPWQKARVFATGPSPEEIAARERAARRAATTPGS